MRPRPAGQGTAPRANPARRRLRQKPGDPRVVSRQWPRAGLRGGPDSSQPPLEFSPTQSPGPMKKDDGKDAAAGGENTGEMRPAPETARRLSADAQCEARGPSKKQVLGEINTS